MMFLLLTT